MSNNSLNSPVRVLIRTRLSELEKIDLSFNLADIKLLNQIREHFLGGNDSSPILHLVTRITDDTKPNRDRSAHVDIVFDYGVPANDPEPEVIAFNVLLEDSALKITSFPHPSIRGRVNKTVNAMKEINLEHGLSFPSRSDFRAETRRRLGAPPFEPDESTV